VLNVSDRRREVVEFLQERAGGPRRPYIGKRLGSNATAALCEPILISKL